MIDTTLEPVGNGFKVKAEGYGLSLPGVADEPIRVECIMSSSSLRSRAHGARAPRSSGASCGSRA